MSKAVRINLGGGNYNQVYREGDRVVKVPKDEPGSDAARRSDIFRATGIATEIYSNLAISADSKSNSWSMPYFPQEVDVPSNDEACAKEILRIYRVTGRIALDGCGPGNFRRDQEGELYLVDYDLCLRRNSIVSESYLSDQSNINELTKYWDWFNQYQRTSTLSTIQKLFYLDKLQNSDINFRHLEFKDVCDYKIRGTIPKSMLGATWQKAFDAANAYLLKNIDDSSASEGISQTNVFLDKLTKIKKSDKKGVKKEVHNWIKDNSSEQKSSDKNSRLYFANTFGLITWQKAFDAAQEYISKNINNSSASKGINQTELFLDKLTKIEKTDHKSVEKEVK